MCAVGVQLCQHSDSWKLKGGGVFYGGFISWTVVIALYSISSSTLLTIKGNEIQMNTSVSDLTRLQLLVSITDIPDEDCQIPSCTSCCVATDALCSHPTVISACLQWEKA